MMRVCVNLFSMPCRKKNNDVQISDVQMCKFQMCRFSSAVPLCSQQNCWDGNHFLRESTYAELATVDDGIEIFY